MRRGHLTRSLVIAMNTRQLVHGVAPGVVVNVTACHARVSSFFPAHTIQVSKCQIQKTNILLNIKTLTIRSSKYVSRGWCHLIIISMSQEVLLVRLDFMSMKIA